MIAGETVQVELRTMDAVDAYNNATAQYSAPQTVQNVICGRMEQYGEAEPGRPYEFSETRTFCFPKGYSEDLRGAIITRAPGDRYEVVGDPTEYTLENLPPLLDWNIKVKAVRRDG